MDTKVRVCVSGAGVFGGYHAAKLAAHPRVEFAGVYDPEHPERAQGLVAEHGGVAFSTREEMIAAADALIIASPAMAHYRQGLDALTHGLHVLVEKPLATRLEDAREMVALADRQGLILQVGHQERFVSAAIGLFDFPERPIRIEARREAPFDVRGSDVSVTLDLMTHDLDLANRLAGCEARDVSSVIQKGPEGRIDDVSAEIIYPDGLQATIKASRTAPARSRTMSIEYPSGVVEIDFFNHALVNNTPHALNAQFGEEACVVDSLAASVDSFVRAILDGDKICVCGHDGAKALALALRVDNAA